MKRAPHCFWTNDVCKRTFLKPGVRARHVHHLRDDITEVPLDQRTAVTVILDGLKPPPVLMKDWTKNVHIMAPKDMRQTDQSSHKVIEKRRRDRINHCLSELSQSVPAAFSKQNSGKLEKAEILEMTVEYLRVVQMTEIGARFETGHWYSSDIWADFVHHYQAGYNDCIREILRYMTDVEGIDARDDRCTRIISYLQTKFKPDTTVSSGAAYRGALERLAHAASSARQQTGRITMDNAARFMPYNLPVTNISPMSTSLASEGSRNRPRVSPTLSSVSENTANINHGAALPFTYFKTLK